MFVGTKLSKTISFCYFAAQGFSLDLTDKQTWQSSDYKSKTTGLYHYSSFAVDGCRDANFASRCCTHTGLNSEVPWWSVDLGNVYTILSVTLVNRAWHRKCVLYFVPNTTLTLCSVVVLS